MGRGISRNSRCDIFGDRLPGVALILINRPGLVAIQSGIVKLLSRGRNLRQRFVELKIIPKDCCRLQVAIRQTGMDQWHASPVRRRGDKLASVAAGVIGQDIADPREAIQVALDRRPADSFRMATARAVCDGSK